MPNSSSLFSLLTVLGAFVGQVSLAQDQPLSVIDWVQQHPNQPPITSRHAQRLKHHVNDARQVWTYVLHAYGRHFTQSAERAALHVHICFGQFRGQHAHNACHVWSTSSTSRSWISPASTVS